MFLRNNVYLKKFRQGLVNINLHLKKTFKNRFFGCQTNMTEQNINWT
jgi:hypothetical protein